MNTLSEPGLKDLRIFRINCQSLVPNPQSLILALCLLIGIAFAQEVPAPAAAPAVNPFELAEPAKPVEPAPVKVAEPVEAKKLAVYVSGASEGVNKSLSSKLVMSMSQSGEYLEIGDMEAFYKEIGKNRDVNINIISQVAKKHKAEVVVIVNLMEAFGEYSVQVRLINTADGQVLKSISLDHAMKSLEDMNTLSLKIAAQLVPSLAVAVPPPVAEVAPAPIAEPAPSVAPMQTSQPSQLTVVEEKCDTKYNKNELLYNVREGFLLGFKNCATELVKETALAKSPLAKKPAPEPGSFITQCVMGNIKDKVDGVPGGEKITNVVENFLQTLLKAALSGGDPKALVSAASNLDITGMMETISGFANGSSCFVDEPYEPPVGTNDGSGGDDDKVVSLGFRIGGNSSSIDRNGKDIGGFQVGMVFDFALSKGFHLQPGIMYIQKGGVYNISRSGGGDDSGDSYSYSGYNNKDVTTHYIEIPVLISLKLAALRLNAGPYFSINAGSSDASFDGNDFGISLGSGVDAGYFYIGMFYDIGLTVTNIRRSNFYGEYYNRTLGFNIGVNL